MLVIAGLAACSVPDVALEGKECPCSDGFSCDTATNTCHAATSGSSCLGPEAAALFTVDFDEGVVPLTPGSGTWTGSGGQAQQTDAGAALAYASSEIAVPSDYRVAATVVATSGAAGVVLRNAIGAKTMYYCDWEPATGTLVLGFTNNGGNPTELMSAMGTPSTDPVTIHAEAKGTNLSCCIDGQAAATLMMIPDTRYPNGQPGLATRASTAIFDDLVVGSI